MIHVKKNLKQKLTTDILSLNKSARKIRIYEIQFFGKFRKSHFFQNFKFLEEYVIFEDVWSPMHPLESVFIIVRVVYDTCEKQYKARN